MRNWPSQLLHKTHVVIGVFWVVRGNVYINFPKADLRRAVEEYNATVTQPSLETEKAADEYIRTIVLLFA